MVRAFSIRDCVCREKRRSKPRSTVMLATTAMRMAGTAAITENRATIRICSRDPARPRRRAWNTRQNSPPMTAIRNKIVRAFETRSTFTTASVGTTGVRLARTRKVTMAERSASPTATSPIRRTHPAVGGAVKGNSAGEAWLISAMNDYVGGKAMWHFGHMPAIAAMCLSKVRLFYNNVAELRQILGVTGSAWGLSAGSEHLNLQVADLLAQRVAVDPQQVGGANLVAPGCRQGHG